MEMRGLFGGELEEREGTSVECVSAEVARALRAGAPREPLPPLPEAVGGVDLVLYEATDDDAVRFARAIDHAKPLEALAPVRSSALDALASAASALAALHAAGVIHGDLDGRAIRVEGERVVLLFPARRPAAGALLGARLHGGASPTIPAYAAPEVVTAYEATAASDVFTLAALAHEIITGRPPLGQIDFGEARRGPFARLASVVAAGLSASPLARPSATALAAALRDAAAVARDLEQPAQAGPYRGAQPGAERAKAPAARAKSVAETSARREQASSMSGILVLLLVVGGMFVFTGAVWLVGVTWSALGGAGRFLLLLALTSGVLGAGVALGKKGYAGSGRALVVLGTELLWADGAYLLDVSNQLDEPAAWTLLGAAMTTVAFALAGALDSAIFAVLAALHYTIFAGALGAWVRTGAPTGPAMYSLAVAAVAASLAFAADRWRGLRFGAPFAVVAALSTFGSSMAALFVLDRRDHRVFGAGWPYLVALVAGVTAAALEARASTDGARRARPYAAGAAVTLGAILALVPSAEAFIRFDDLPYLFAAVAVGFGILGASFLHPRLARDPATQALGVLVGLVSAVTGPSILFLVKCWDKDGLDALCRPQGIYLTLVLVVSAALVGLSYALGKRARNKLVYRLVELAGLAQIFGTFTLQSLVRTKDGFYPLVVLGVGAACFFVGAKTKRATLVVLASAALLLNLSIQYFAKLWDVFPASLLVLVFGLVLLAAGVLYERKLKQRLPGLREWG